MADPIDESSLLKLYGLSSLDPQQWEDPAVAEDANDDALGLALSVAQTPILGGDDGSGDGDRTTIRREMDDPLGLKRKLEMYVARGGLSFRDLQHGAENLKRVVEERGEEVRILVEREFGRFVAVKGSTDGTSALKASHGIFLITLLLSANVAAFRDMKMDILAEGSDYGTRDIRETIKVTSHKAETLFLPLLSNALKAQKLKSTLGVFERSKFLFGLPRALRVNVRAGKYEAALREYHKGLYLYNNRPNQLLPISIPMASNSLAPPSAIHARREQQKRLMSKIWKEVENVMAEMRMRLEDGLRGSSEADDGAGIGVDDPLGSGRVELGIDEVEKSIEILLELSPREDPVWLYLDSQHRYILAKMKAVYQKRVKQLELVKLDEAAKLMDGTARAWNLKKSVDTLMQGDSESNLDIAKSAGSATWSATLEVVHAVSGVLMQTVPELWKICRGYKEGKYRRKNVKITSEEVATGFLRCRKMALDIIKLYISLLGQFFTLSDISIASARKPGQSASQSSNLGQSTGHSEAAMPDFVPRNANSLITCHYASKILAEILDSAGEIDALTGPNSGQSVSSPVTSTDLGQEAKKAMRDFVESCRWRLEEAICETWSRDAKEFFRLEDWAVNPSTIGTTIYLQKIASLQKHNATVAWQVAGGSTEYGADKSAVPVVFVHKIKECFLDSLYYFLDGMVHLALSGEEPLVGDEVVQNHGVDWRDKDTRIVLTMSNILHLQTKLLPTMLTKFEALYGLKSVDDKDMLQQIIGQVDEVLFEDYLKRKRETLQQITDTGLLGPGVDPLTEVRPKDVRPYMLKDLLCLVDAPAHVTTLAPALTQRVIETLAKELARSLLRAFSQIHQMGLGAMLSATLEVEFLDRSLLPYVNQDAMDVLNEIYASISQAYASYKEGPAGSARGADNLNQELENLKQVLLDARRATGVQFICFRKQTS
ncbi:hypothetical protein QFC20_000954 [Naganishia adeliensis]|uniref:Uncharacterized protein n=1 Tax=Naganishia adeliensis TaxID=92952 RepID=A0ACC2WV01_9TREE|nr:hypothetical protein QFC20_000954 [Naganishia adeliensis]